MTQDIDTYCEALIEKHMDKVASDEQEYSEAIEHAILEVEGIIEALQENYRKMYLTAETVTNKLDDAMQKEINFYKQALLKLRNE